MRNINNHHIGIFPSVCLNSHRPSLDDFECICNLYPLCCFIVLVRSCFFFLLFPVCISYVHKETTCISFWASLFHRRPPLVAYFCETNVTTLHSLIWEYSPFKRTMLQNMNLLKKRRKKPENWAIEWLKRRRNQFWHESISSIFGNCYWVWKDCENMFRNRFDYVQMEIFRFRSNLGEEKGDKFGVIIWHWFLIIFLPARHTSSNQTTISIWVW